MHRLHHILLCGSSLRWLQVTGLLFDTPEEFLRLGKLHFPPRNAVTTAAHDLARLCKAAAEYVHR